MQTLSTALRDAVDAGNKQRCLLVFGDGELSNENIAISKGIVVEEQFNSEEELTIGSCPSVQISFDLLNDTGDLTNFSFGWFTAYLGARIDAGTPTEITRTFTEEGSSKTYAFAPLGVFYAERPLTLVKKVISITAYDRMLLLRRDMPSAATLSLTYPTTIGTIVQKICTYLGISATSYTFLNYDLVVSEEPREFATATIRDVIGWVAECACSIARFNRSGDLEFAWFTTTSASYDESSYSSFVPVRYTTEPIDGLYLRDTDNNTETNVGTNKINNYLILDNPFLKGG